MAAVEAKCQPKRDHRPLPEPLVQAVSVHLISDLSSIVCQYCQPRIEFGVVTGEHYEEMKAQGWRMVSEADLNEEMGQHFASYYIANCGIRALGPRESFNHLCNVIIIEEGFPYFGILATNCDGILQKGPSYGRAQTPEGHALTFITLEGKYLGKVIVNEDTDTNGAPVNFVKLRTHQSAPHEVWPIENTSETQEALSKCFARGLVAPDQKSRCARTCPALCVRD